MAEFIDFNDPAVPVGKRKMAFVKWLMQRHHHTLEEAKAAAHRKFGAGPAADARQWQRDDARADQRWQEHIQRGVRRWGHAGGK
ncbi:MAG: hypothetical protein RLZZ631_1298 [Cyanobacteriota bacterium]|jgi:hypothetical protein